MSKVGQAPAGIYSDDGKVLDGFINFDSSISRLIREYPTLAALQASLPLPIGQYMVTGSDTVYVSDGVVLYNAKTGADVSSLRYVGHHVFLPDSFSSTNKQILTYDPQFAHEDLVGLQVEWPNWYVDNTTSGVETGTGAVATLTASIEYPIGTRNQLTFSGSPSGTIADVSNLKSDPLSFTIPKGSKYIIRSFFVSTAGIVFCNKAAGAYGGALSEFGASGLTDKTMSGTINSSGANQYYGACAITAKSSKRAVALVGTSRIQGKGDTTDSSMQTGTIERSIGQFVCSANYGVNGDRADWYLTKAVNRANMLAYFTDIISDLGFNDYDSGGRSAAQVAADRQTLIAGKFAGKRIGWVTASPHTTSTDSFATPGNQSIPSAPIEAIRVADNNSLRSGLINGIDYVIDVANIMETFRDSGIWNSPGWTSDGKHELQKANLAIVAARAVPVFKF